MLHTSNNFIQVPCRAFLGDLKASNQQKIRLANMLFAFFIAVGSVLGYLAMFPQRFPIMFTFTITKACDPICAYVKSCLFFSMLLLVS
ncbi:hypothetical protein HN51_066908 [Arachis hypogaea]